MVSGDDYACRFCGACLAMQPKRTVPFTRAVDALPLKPEK